MHDVLELALNYSWTLKTEVWSLFKSSQSSAGALTEWPHTHMRRHHFNINKLNLSCFSNKKVIIHFKDFLYQVYYN